MKVVTIALVILAAPPASALGHAILIDSIPAVNATIPPGHETVTLRFNSRIDWARSRVTLIAPDKTQTRIPASPDGPPDVMTMSADLVPGGYTIRWQVLAVDGHITRGDVPFSVAVP